MRHRIWLSAIGAVLITAACLPDLQPLPPLEVPVVESACGDGVIATLDDGGETGESCDPGDAAVQGCTGCRVTCEGFLDSISDHCYFVAGSDTSFNAASTTCFGVGAHVVTFAGPGEVTIANGLADGGAYWVGLTTDNRLNGAYAPASPDEPGFPAPPPAGPCDGCFADGDEAGVFPIAAGVDAAASFGCLAGGGEHGAWQRVPCESDDRALTTICEREPAGRRIQSCAGGFCFTLKATTGEKTYLLVVSPDGPDQAAATCADYGGHLVVWSSREEREQAAREILARLTIDREALTLWIGLHADAGAWAWDDGELLDGGAPPSPWGDRQPSAGGLRAYMRLSPTSYDTQLAHTEAHDGGDSRPYLCEKQP